MTDELRGCWARVVVRSAKAAVFPIPKLVGLDSPYRCIVKPIVNYAVQPQEGRVITLAIPELVESHWYRSLLHDRRPEAIRALRLFNGNRRVIVATLPHHLRA